MLIRKRDHRHQERAGRFWSFRENHRLPWSRTTKFVYTVNITGTHSDGTEQWPNCHYGHEPVHRDVSVNIDVSSVVNFGPNIPGWKQKQANHQSVTTSMTGTVYHFRRVINTGFFTYRWIKDQGCDSGTYVGSGSAYVGAQLMPTMAGYLGTTPDPDALNQANSKILNSYITATNSWRGGNFAAEFGETVEMLLHPLRSLYKRSWTFVGKLNRLKKVYQRNPVAYSKALADLWLGFSFGVKPLIEDLNDFANTVTKYQSGYNFGDVERIGGHGYQRTLLEEGYIDVSSGAFGIGGNMSYHSVTRDSHVFYKGAIWQSPSFGHRTLEQFGFDSFDIIPATWEAIPFSFLIDYFLNVQEVLDSMRYWTARVAWLQRTVRNTVTLNIRTPLQNAPTRLLYTYVFSDPGFYVSATSIERGALTSIPYPDFHVKFPKFSSLKWLNVAALARQFAGTKPLHAQDKSSFL